MAVSDGAQATKAPHPNPLPEGRAPVKLGALCRRSRRGREQRLRLRPHALELSLTYMGTSIDSPAKLAGVISRAQH
jgi:hypothetical protein